MTCATLMVACLRGRLRWPARADASIHTHCDPAGVTTLAIAGAGRHQPTQAIACGSRHPWEEEIRHAQGFQDFLMRGNVVDLAIAVVIGGAFGRSSRPS